MLPLAGYCSKRHVILAKRDACAIGWSGRRVPDGQDGLHSGSACCTDIGSIAIVASTPPYDAEAAVREVIFLDWNG